VLAPEDFRILRVREGFEGGVRGEAGLRLERVAPTRSALSIVEAAAAP